MEYIMPRKIISLRLILIIASIIILSNNIWGQSNCHFINQDVLIIDGAGQYSPGDTLCLESRIQRNYLLFKNIHGTAEKPIVITNSGGQVEIVTPHFYGIKFDHCSHVKLSGAANPAIRYGIYISYVDQGAGISIDNQSTDIEIENIEIANIPIAGIYAKTEPFQGDCNNLITRDKFTMFNIKIHDCYLHDIADEGFYVGSSKYTGQTIVADPNTYPCNGSVVLPHVIEGVEIYNNIVENTGWDGIQVSSAISGCKIYNNIIRNDSYRETNYQMSGILIGGGSNCDCYNNQIFDGKGDGIDVLGFGNHNIFNNLIVRAGKSYQSNQPATNFQKHAIWVGTVETQTNTELRIYNNTIISPRTFGLKLTNLSIGSYKIYNNIIVNPGAYSVLGDDSYFSLSSGINFIQSNNLLKPSISDVNFINASNDNFDLQPSSPAVNTGMNLAVYNLTSDILGRPRPFGQAYDIGAFESQESINGINEPSDKREKIEPLILPNPLKVSAILSYDLPEPMNVKIYIIDALGKNIKLLRDENQLESKQQIELDRSDFEAGFYFLVMECKLGRFSEKLIII